MIRLTEEQRKNHNRAITIIILGMILAAFVSLNANRFLLSSALYLGLLALSIFLFFVWNKF
jgi:hypothetical protein